MARRSDDYSTTTFSIASTEDGTTYSSELVELPSLYVCDAYHDGERWHVVAGGVHVSMRESGIESIDAFDAPDFECARVLGGDGYLLALGFRRTDGETDRGRLQIVGVDLVERCGSPRTARLLRALSGPKAQVVRPKTVVPLLG